MAKKENADYYLKSFTVCGTMGAYLKYVEYLK
jgi:hypothetical protein